MPKPQLGQALRAARMLAKLSLQDVASEVQASHQYVSKLERNLATPSLHMLHRLDRLLRIPDEILLTYIRYGVNGDQPRSAC